MRNIFGICLSRRKKQKMFKTRSPSLFLRRAKRWKQSALLFSIILLYTGRTPCSNIFMTKWCFWKRSKWVWDSMKKHKNKFLKCFSGVLEHLKMKNLSTPLVSWFRISKSWNIWWNYHLQIINSYKILRVTLVSIHITIDICRLFYESLSQ